MSSCMTQAASQLTSIFAVQLRTAVVPGSMQYVLQLTIIMTVKADIHM